jgi:hypothetical protein
MGTEQSKTAASRIEELEEHLRRCCEQAYGKSALVMVSAGTLVEAADLLTRLKPVLEENEQLKRLIWEMDEHVDDCCGCLGHIDQEFRDRINAASLSPSIRSNPDGE